MLKSLFLLVILLSTNGFAESTALTPKEILLNSQLEKKSPKKTPSIKGAFAPFTGKVIGDKVRMRLQPDLDGYIVRELTKNELLSIIDQEGDYYCVEPPEPLKAYVFRSFVLDNVVEGNRVNVRLEPYLEAPIISHLNSGDQIDGVVSPLNKKWLEISPPSNTRFYVSKEYLEHAGGPELKAKMAKRKTSVEQMLEAASLFSRSEMKKTFEEIQFDRIKQGFSNIINEYGDFPRMVVLAKEGLANAQEEYLQKRIQFLEQKASLVKISDTNQTNQASSYIPQQLVQMWEPIEEALYANWLKLNDQNDQNDRNSFYEEQKLVATSLSGVLEIYKSPIRHRPGDYIVKNKNLPIAYVYSTKIDLEKYVGKKITLLASPRSNNNFAFPAYFVHEVE